MSGTEFATGCPRRHDAGAAQVTRHWHVRSRKADRLASENLYLDFGQPVQLEGICLCCWSAKRSNLTLKIGGAAYRISVQENLRDARSECFE